MNICTVCGYKHLLYPIEENPICPSCYTEYGYDDEMASLGTLRQRWIDAGMPWRASTVQPQPADWNPALQVQELLGVEDVSDADTSLGTIFVYISEVEPSHFRQIQPITRTFVYGVAIDTLGIGTMGTL